MIFVHGAPNVAISATSGLRAGPQCDVTGGLFKRFSTAMMAKGCISAALQWQLQGLFWCFLFSYGSWHLVRNWWMRRSLREASGKTLCNSTLCSRTCSGYFEESRSTAGSRPAESLGTGKDRQSLKVWHCIPTVLKQPRYVTKTVNLDIMAYSITIGTAPNLPLPTSTKLFDRPRAGWEPDSSK